MAVLIIVLKTIVAVLSVLLSLLILLPQLRATDGSTTPRGQSHRTYHMDNRLPQPETLPHARIRERRHR